MRFLTHIGCLSSRTDWDISGEDRLCASQLKWRVLRVNIILYRKREMKLGLSLSRWVSWARCAALWIMLVRGDRSLLRVCLTKPSCQMFLYCPKLGGTGRPDAMLHHLDSNQRIVTHANQTESVILAERNKCKWVAPAEGQTWKWINLVLQ